MKMEEYQEVNKKETEEETGKQYTVSPRSVVHFYIVSRDKLDLSLIASVL